MKKSSWEGGRSICCTEATGSGYGPRPRQPRSAAARGEPDGRLARLDVRRHPALATTVGSRPALQNDSLKTSTRSHSAPLTRDERRTRTDASRELDAGAALPASAGVPAMRPSHWLLVAILARRHRHIGGPVMQAHHNFQAAAFARPPA